MDHDYISPAIQHNERGVLAAACSLIPSLQTMSTLLDLLSSEECFKRILAKTVRKEVLTYKFPFDKHVFVAQQRAELYCLPGIDSKGERIDYSFIDSRPDDVTRCDLTRANDETVMLSLYLYHETSERHIRIIG